MTEPIDPIPTTAAGWPYLADNAPVADQPIYTQRLAAALAGSAPNPAAPSADTGWVTSGADPVMATNWELTSYVLRRAAGRVLGRVVAIYTGPATAANSSGDISPDILAFTLPAGWRNTAPYTYPTRAQRPGTTEWVAKALTNGQMILTHGTPTATISTGLTLDFLIDHPSN